MDSNKYKHAWFWSSNFWNVNNFKQKKNAWYLLFDNRVIEILPRQQTTGQTCLKITKNVKIVEFHYCIWNHREKCIQISTNKPGIGLVIPEIIFENLEFWENKQFCSVKPTPPRGKC